MDKDYVAEILRAAGKRHSAEPMGVAGVIQDALAAAGFDVVQRAGAGFHRRVTRLRLR